MSAKRLLGPVGSVAMHSVVIVLLVKLLVFEGHHDEEMVEVRMVELPERLMEPVEQQKPVEEAAEAMEPPELKLLDSLPEAMTEPTLEPLPELQALAIAPLKSPLVLKGVMAGRSEAGRSRLLRKYGGLYGNRAEQAVVRGLDWLVRVQCEDGSWGVSTSRSMTAKQERMRLTGLGLLAFLAHGETPQSGTYGATVQRAIEFVLEQQDEKTGRFCPFSKTVGSHDDIGVYAHAMATYALAEAYSLARIPLLEVPLKKAVAVILRGQQQGGGWDHRYQHDRWSDLSVAAWQIQALKAADWAGVAVEGVQAALERSVPFLEGMHEAEGRFYYRTGNKKPSSGLDYMTGAAVLCLQLLDHRNSEVVKAGLKHLRSVECSDWLEGWEKTARNKSFNIAYEWYYSTQAIFQQGGAHWVHWNKKFAPMLIGAQDPSGAWKPPAEEAETLTKDMLYTTEFCVLSLQVYYRLLPSFSAAVGTREVTFVDDVDIEIY